MWPWRIGALLIVWALSLYGVAQVMQLPGDWFGDHTICGPWGCGPELPALIAWHGSVLVIAALPTALLVCCAAPEWLRRVGWALMAIGLIGAAGVIAWDLSHWLPAVSTDRQQFALQRSLFGLLVVFSDVPVVPAILAGVTLMLFGRRNQQRHQEIQNPKRY